ncbi:hypothetical protein BLNAU_16327 [Blattamonas nauphoetae]|uniref:Uncharacterized protein n=1 Tax=Blattamonas nauphoetae TaxID=2049346 RepID=A0ABQ9XBD0_9EUKA|nr:hypothetical protein BLNAU_16327 [Blattamonas nauphoetae]
METRSSGLSFDGLPTTPHGLPLFKLAIASLKVLTGTMNLQPALDVSLEAKAVKFLESIDPQNQESAEGFIKTFGRTTDASSTKFTRSMVVLLSSPKLAIKTAAMKMLARLIVFYSENILLALLRADLIHQLITSLNPLSLSFADAVDIHISLIANIYNSVYLARPIDLPQLGIEDRDERQAVYEMVLQQVLVPSEHQQ